MSDPVILKREEYDALRAELAAAKECNEYLKAEHARLRAELANWKESYESSRAECVSIRAELAAANTRADRADEMNGHRAREMLRLSSELAARDALLREAGESLMLGYTENTRALARRIDALLNGGDDGH